jgi:hypothetical protein
MTRVLLLLSLSVALLLYSTPASAETSLQFNMPGLQAPIDPDVAGARFVLLHGVNTSVHGLDLGLFSFSEAGTRSGFSANFGFSRVSGRSSGCAGSFINVHSGDDTGINAGFINIVKTIDHGLNLGFVNISEGFSMVDVGGLSMSERSEIQLGFVNFTKEIENFQFGFLNFAENGFFPVFPFVNFPKK